MVSHNYFVYILTNLKKTTLYIGMTNDIARRLEEHSKNAGNLSTFAGKYFCHLLMCYERFSSVEHAIAREKELKKWSRDKKDALIKSMNPHWLLLNTEVQEY